MERKSGSGLASAIPYVDLGVMDYQEVYDLQIELAEKRITGELETDLFLVVEHPRVFTLGRRGGRENLTVSEAFLEKENVPVVQVERGGNITYHGPGQLVVYPIINLEKAKIAVKDYVGRLEEIMIRLAEGEGVTAVRDPRNHGVWASGMKIGSVGIALRRGVSFHGLALNVNLSLVPFSWINPCGLTGVAMTSIENELGKEVSFDKVKEKLAGHIKDLFLVDLVPGKLPKTAKAG